MSQEETISMPINIVILMVFLIIVLILTKFWDPQGGWKLIQNIYTFITVFVLSMIKGALR